MKRFVLPLLFIMNLAVHADPVVVDEIAFPLVESEKLRFRVVKVVAPLEFPWGMEFLPDGRLLVTERPGRLWLKDGSRMIQVNGVPAVQVGGQGGLLDVISHPSFSDNGLIYLSYAASYSGGSATRVARARLEGESLLDVRVIFEMNPSGSGGVHFGSRFAFDDKGYLYVSLGERGDRNKAQQLNAHHGKIVRLFDDGRVPEDNPFAGSPGRHPEIYSFGHRNPQGLVFDRETGVLWSHEHGPRGGDALHIVRPGRNYGWPLATHGREYSGPSIGDIPEQVEGVEIPVIHWTPSIAPCGLAQVRGGPLREWLGNLFAGALAGQQIRRIEVEGEKVVHQEVLLKDQVGRVREIVQGHDGNVWFATDDPKGGVFRIERIE